MYRQHLVLESSAENVIEQRDPMLEEIYNPYNYLEFDTLKLKLDAAVELPRIPLNDYRLPDNGGDKIADSIKNGDARVVTDGSFKDKKGAVAVKVYAGTRTTKCITAVAWAPGQAHKQSAYRSKLTGIDCALAIIKALVDQHKISSAEIEIALDSKTAKDQLKDFRHPPHVSQPLADILQDIRYRLIESLPENIKIRWRWVEGYQKEKGRIYIDWWGRQNIKVDHLAKWFLSPRFIYEKSAIYVD